MVENLSNCGMSESNILVNMAPPSAFRLENTGCAAVILTTRQSGACLGISVVEPH